MAGTSGKTLDTQGLVPDSFLGGHGGHPVHVLNEHFGQRDCLPQPAVAKVFGRVARGPSLEFVVWKHRPFGERYWGMLYDLTVPDRRGDMVARN